MMPPEAIRASPGAWGMIQRREMLAFAAVAVASPALVLAAPAPAPKGLRQPWRAFRAGPDYAAFCQAIRKLKANPDPASADSWAYWANIHQDQCPHGKPYFLAWHRGFLHLFEAKLQQLAKRNSLRIPYWDYFADPALPAEFLQGDVSSNPLFEPRIGANVADAIDYGPFAAGVTRFDRGPATAFEATIEAIPHNRVHNLIGGTMATPLSPLDPLFWLHHANVDRLWEAWCAAGQGRTMPAADAAYWAGDFDYGRAGTLPRSQTIAVAGLGYGYADVQLPRPAPPRVGAAASEGAARTGAVRSTAPPPRPPAAMAMPPMATVQPPGQGANRGVFNLAPSSSAAARRRIVQRPRAGQPAARADGAADGQSGRKRTRARRRAAAGRSCGAAACSAAGRVRDRARRGAPDGIGRCRGLFLQSVSEYSR